jgi:hypothetical protein
MTKKVNEGNVDEVKLKAEDHWRFNERWLHMVFVDAFVHGHKHGVESKRQRRIRKENKEVTNARHTNSL